MEGNKPKLRGLMDPRQGSVDRFSRCLTCAGDMNSCAGHFAHIELSKCVFHIGFLPVIMKTLRCVCFYCSRLLIGKNNSKCLEVMAKTRLNTHRRFEMMYDVCKNRKRCEELLEEGQSDTQGCGKPQPTYRRLGLELFYEYKSNIAHDVHEKKNILTPEKVREIFKNISDEDCRIMGIDLLSIRPEWMIISVLPVPPLCVRPAVMAPNMLRCHDDLTFKLADIIRTNNMLKSNEMHGAAPHLIAEDWKMLQYHCSTLFDNEIPGLPKAIQKSGRPLKSIKQRLKSKEGRIRGNLMGKRVDHSARAVITPDPNLDIDEVGTPRSIAMNLSIPEIVTPFNISALQELVHNGPTQYPGAKYIIRDTGERIDLRFHPRTSDLHLQYGYVVERHLRDGDIIVFNRQPTLHKMSMMGHRIRVLPWSTFRLNLSVTTPYNADFDGDEMNMHIPQSVETKAEVKELSMVTKLFITPQSNRPCMGIVQDSLTGACILTRRDTFIELENVMNLVMWADYSNANLPLPAILKPKPLWTGKQLFSLFIPKGVNCIGTHSTHPDTEDQSSFRYISPGDTKVLIEDGVLHSGILCSKTLGRSSGSLIHIIVLELGWQVAKIFFSQIQRFINNYLLIAGHSIGISDCIADRNTYSEIQESIFESKRQVIEIIERAHNNELKPTPGNTLKQTFENEVNKILNACRDSTGSCAQRSLSIYNNFKTMVVAGSKGSKINISQIIAVVGQQNVDGKRIPFSFRSRTLPHFIKDDYGPESCGFVENSYLSGLTPSEFFFHAMGGREGVIDTAIKTSETGYIQRRLIKAMESIMVSYDGTVRNSNRHLIQLRYGEDGMSGEFIEFQHLSTLKLSDQMFERKFKFDVSDQKSISECYQEDIVKDLFTNAHILQEILKEWEQLKKDRTILRTVFKDGESKVALPVNIPRLLWNAKKIFNLNYRQPTDLHPLRVISGVRDLIEHLVIVKGSDKISIEAQANAILLLSAHIRASLCCKQLQTDNRLSTVAFEWVLGEIETRFNYSQAQPGEMVGPLAAQSLGEPATQMTLNTFHYAGVSSKNVTLGVPRLREIINVAKVPKTPSLTIFLKPEIAGEVEFTKRVLCRLEHTTLRDLCSSTSIYYDPDPLNSIIETDRDFVSDFYETPEAQITPLSSWVLRVEVDRRRVIDKKLSMEFIADKIVKVFGSDVNVIFSDDNAQHLAIHVRIIDLHKDDNNNDNDIEDENKIDDELFLRCIESYILNDMELIGIESIHKVYMHKPTSEQEKRRVIINDKGEYETVSEWILETDGNGLAKVLADRDVDPTRTTSNDVCEIFSVLGVEAARRAVEREIKHVISFDGSYVNYRHLALLCDVMTSRGNLMAITRHGINRQEVGALMRSSFEESVDVILDAAFHSEVDQLRGVSENIIVGQVPPIGTCCFSLYLDSERSKQAIEVPIPIVNGFEDTTFGIFYGNAASPSIPQTPMNISTQWNPYSSGQMTDTIWSPSNATSYAPSMSPALSEISRRGRVSSPYSPLASVSQSPSLYDPLLKSPAYNFSGTSPAYMPPETPYNVKSPGPSYMSGLSTFMTPRQGPTSPSLNFGTDDLSSITDATTGYSVTGPKYLRSDKRDSGYGHGPGSTYFSPTSPTYSPSNRNSVYPMNAANYSPTCPTFLASPKHSPASPLSSPSVSFSPTSPVAAGKSSSISHVYSPSYRGQTSAQYTPSYDDAYQKYSPSSPAGFYSGSENPSFSATPNSPYSRDTYSPTVGRARKETYSPIEAGDQLSTADVCALSYFDKCRQFKNCKKSQHLTNWIERCLQHQLIKNNKFCNITTQPDHSGCTLEKEKEYFETIILEDIQLLGLTPDQYSKTSDYFDTLLNYAEQLILNGDAYCDNTPTTLMRALRIQKQASPYRYTSTETNLQRWISMKNGDEPEWCLRAKIDFSSENGCLRDPTLYRSCSDIHPVHKNKYKIYPTYDFACPIVDSIEGVTHALRTSEYHDRDDQYRWIITKLSLREPIIFEYSRLCMQHTVLSKRKLTKIVESGIVDSWDDPRMPTIRGLLRHGLTLSGLREFILAQGFSKSVVNMKFDKLWAFNKRIIEPISPRLTALNTHELIEATIINEIPEHFRQVPLVPKNLSSPLKTIHFTHKIYINRTDIERKKTGDTITLMNWGNAQIVRKDLTRIELKLDLANKDFSSTTKITWLDTFKADHLVPLTIIVYENLLTKAVITADDDFEKFINYESRKSIKAVGESYFKSLKKGDIIQIVKSGFFICDSTYIDNNVVLIEIPSANQPLESSGDSKKVKKLEPSKINDKKTKTCKSPEVTEPSSLQIKSTSSNGTKQKKTKLGIIASKENDFSQWYTQVLLKSEMMDYSGISGCYVIRPLSYSVWEQIQKFFDFEIKKLGVENCYFPMFVSESALAKEKNHIEDFAPEVAWVTRAGNTDLPEPIAIRPTSETVVYPIIAKWIQSHRDLPMKLNQWCNVVRWEFKHPTPFLRTREFLWQEGHTVYVNKDEAIKEVYQILDLYERIYTDLLAIPVVKGRKSEAEKFAGAEFTTTVECYISACGRGLQGATSHHLGQNFSKMFDIGFEDPTTNQRDFAHQNSWGISTRTIGAMVMVHGDNRGLILPPRVSPIQVVIIPCGINTQTNETEKNHILAYCDKILLSLLSENIRVKVDIRDYVTPGWRFNYWELKGVPIRIEVGPKDVKNSVFILVRRDTGQKISLPIDQVCENIKTQLDLIHEALFNKAAEDLKNNSSWCDDWDSFIDNLNASKIIYSPFCGNKDCEDMIRKLSSYEHEESDGKGDVRVVVSMGAKSLCIPLVQSKKLEKDTKCFRKD
ncbi:hypothetical protein HZS_2317, partial [Henneguya salminicola]